MLLAHLLLTNSHKINLRLVKVVLCTLNKPNTAQIFALYKPQLINEVGGRAKLPKDGIIHFFIVHLHAEVLGDLHNLLLGQEEEILLFLA